MAANRGARSIGTGSEGYCGLASRTCAAGTGLQNGRFFAQFGIGLARSIGRIQGITHRAWTARQVITDERNIAFLSLWIGHAGSSSNYRAEGCLVERISPCQFSEGFSMLSMTMTSMGPLVDSSFSPSCSCTAVKMDGPEVSGVFRGRFRILTLRTDQMYCTKCGVELRDSDCFCSHCGVRSSTRPCRVKRAAQTGRHIRTEIATRANVVDGLYQGIPISQD